MASLNFPANPSDGDYYEGFEYDSTFGVWKRVGGSGAASMTVSETPPAQGLTSGAMWLDSTTGNTYIYYEDGDNSQWVQSAGVDLMASRGSDFTIQTTAPANPVDGDIWYDPTEGFTYIYYEDVDSSQWVQFGLTRNGAPGIDGADGVDGSDGIGIPSGGTEGQALVKSSATDYAVEWGSVAGGGGLLTLDSDTINVDFNDSSSLYTRSVAGDVTFTGSDYTAGATKKVYLQGDTVKRSLTFPAGWTFLNDKPTAIGANKKNMLDLNSFGTSESTTVALWLGVSAFEAVTATGGVETDVEIGGIVYRIHTFANTGSASFNVTGIGSDNTVEYLAVAGGGGGGGSGDANTRGGGGGAGGFVSTSYNVLSLDYPVLVGSGGAAGAAGLYNPGSNGSDTSIFGITLAGGGGGGAYGVSGGIGIDGGSGGGGGTDTAAVGGAAINGRGNSGGQSSSYSNSTSSGAGGGGGFGSAGEVGQTDGTGHGGDGGAGIASSISGNSFVYAAGGGAGGGTVGGTAEIGAGVGGSGTQAGSPASQNTGSGGGGGSSQNNSNAGGSGGSGIVIIRYPITDPN